MRNFIILIVGISIFGLSGCLSFNSERAPVKETERIIVVPDDTERKVKVAP
ncbi:MAG: hypothetical protein K2P74_05170 [Nitrosomonas sp.]|nr:hypothetical protein [Nitrosomonas sp.]